jgi:hypothetical protein
VITPARQLRIQNPCATSMTRGRLGLRAAAASDGGSCGATGGRGGVAGSIPVLGSVRRSASPAGNEWQDRPESATTRRRQLLGLLVTEAFDDSDETYGHRRVHA